MIHITSVLAVPIPAKIKSSVDPPRAPGAREFMAYVIAEPCIGTKRYRPALTPARWIAFIPKKDSDSSLTRRMLYIDPVECI